MSGSCLASTSYLMADDIKNERDDTAKVCMTLHDFEVHLRKAYAEGRYDGHSMSESESLEWVTEDWQKSHTKGRLEEVAKLALAPLESAWHLVLEDASVWPNPIQLANAIWRALYEVPSDNDIKLLRGAACAYRELCLTPMLNKKLPMVRRALEKLQAKGPGDV